MNESSGPTRAVRDKIARMSPSVNDVADLIDPGPSIVCLAVTHLYGCADIKQMADYAKATLRLGRVRPAGVEPLNEQVITVIGEIVDCCRHILPELHGAQDDGRPIIRNDVTNVFFPLFWRTADQKDFYVLAPVEPELALVLAGLDRFPEERISGVALAGVPIAQNAND